jgi:uncharacterized protein
VKLINRSQKTEVVSEVKTMKTFAQRAIGLIGTKKFEDRGLFFPNERWPHTFFMSIPIDIVYVNKDMKVVHIDHNLKPWRIGLPVLSAWALIELPAGLAKAKQLTLGDELYVGH